MSNSVKLRVGSISLAGDVTDGSMARAIHEAMAVQFPPGANEDPNWRRKLAVAIAQGVVDHLVANAQAIMVTVPNTGGSGTHEQPATKIDKW
jgi:hypothetical protein